MRRAVTDDYSNATDLADYLAKKGIPFRQAHAISGRAVREGIERGKYLQDFTLDEYKALSPLIEDDVYEAIKPETCVRNRNSYGGTSYKEVARQLAAARELIKSEHDVSEADAEKQIRVE